jgi:hypothetical protein
MGIFDRIDKKIASREEGIRISDLLDLPPAMRKLMNRIVREEEVTVEAAAAHLGESPDKARQMLETLVEKGYLQCEKTRTGPVYRVHYGRTNPKDVPGSVWFALDKKIEK